MRTIFLLLMVICFTINIPAQNPIANKNRKDDIIAKNDNTKKFIPYFKLLNKDKWNRVSEFRFESVFLELAVEWENNEYVLIEMKGKKNILVRDKDYSKISDAIIEITIGNKTQRM